MLNKMMADQASLPTNENETSIIRDFTTSFWLQLILAQSSLYTQIDNDNKRPLQNCELSRVSVYLHSLSYDLDPFGGLRGFLIFLLGSYPKKGFINAWRRAYSH